MGSAQVQYRLDCSTPHLNTNTIPCRVQDQYRCIAGHRALGGYGWHYTFDAQEGVLGLCGEQRVGLLISSILVWAGISSYISVITTVRNPPKHPHWPSLRPLQTLVPTHLRLSGLLLLLYMTPYLPTNSRTNYNNPLHPQCPQKALLYHCTCRGTVITQTLGVTKPFGDSFQSSKSMGIQDPLKGAPHSHGFLQPKGRHIALISYSKNK